MKGQGNLSLAVDDLARIGQMGFDRGRHGGERVIGGDWIDATLAPTVPIGDTDPFADRYGRFWYGTTHPSRGQEVHVAFASGNGGNKIYVIPARHMVVAITSRAYGRGYGQRRSQDILRALLAVA